MSFQRDVAPSDTERSSRITERRERDRVMESSVTWRMERELIDGISRKIAAIPRIPWKTLSRKIANKLMEMRLPIYTVISLRPVSNGSHKKSGMPKHPASSGNPKGFDKTQ